MLHRPHSDRRFRWKQAYWKAGRSRALPRAFFHSTQPNQHSWHGCSWWHPSRRSPIWTGSTTWNSYPVTKPQVQMVYLQRSLRLVVTLWWSNSTSSYLTSGRRESAPRVQGWSHNYSVQKELQIYMRQLQRDHSTLHHWQTICQGNPKSHMARHWKHYPEAQCSFRGGRSTNNMMFTLCQLIEKCCEQHQQLHIIFVDLVKAFDTINQPLMWTFCSGLAYHQR